MRKDEKLIHLLNTRNYNIANFFSVTPNMKIINKTFDIDEEKNDLRAHILQLLKLASSKSVNIRSFSEDKPKGNRFVYGNTEADIDEILKVIKQNCEEGKYSIIDETIDTHDGGVSGVFYNDILEFSPNDTPRCVEKEGVCSLPSIIGKELIKRVYGFDLSLYPEIWERVEFSIHPYREGVQRKHEIVWELEEVKPRATKTTIKWPNNFSKFVGDKTFGLLIADILGFPVPRTTVIARSVAPFIFGVDINVEKWIRTAPIVKEPGKYYTGNKWCDPFKLMNDEEAKGSNDTNIAAILSQDAVNAVFSGAAIITDKDETTITEYTPGEGDDYMIGKSSIVVVPEEVSKAVTELILAIRSKHHIIGNVSIEWVYDGETAWIVQMNQINTVGQGCTIVDGDPAYYDQFEVIQGLEALRSKINDIKDKDIGIELIGDVGICSNFGDLLRQANIPSFITR